MDPNRRITVIIGLAIVGLLVVIIIYMIVLRATPTESPENATITPTISQQELDEKSQEYQQSIQKQPPIQAKNLPTIPPTQGGGIDINANATIASATEISKLVSQLPRTESYQAVAGGTYTVTIPRPTQYNNTWSLFIDVSPIDFMVPLNDPDYSVQKAAFLQGADLALNWMRGQGADTSKIAIVWGPKKFMQDRAVEWLKK